MKTAYLNIRIEPILIKEMNLFIEKQQGKIDSINSVSELVRKAVIKFMKEENEKNRI